MSNSINNGFNNLNGKIAEKINKKLSENINSNVPESLLSQAMKSQDEKDKMGFLGKIFGIHNHNDIHIAGFISISLIFSGILFTAFKYTEIEHVKTFWAIILPIVSSCLGYIFGKNKSEVSKNN